MYKLLRSFLFLFDPERVHYFSMNSLSLLCKIPGFRYLLASAFRPKGNIQFPIFNIQFPNRVGLGAGFDKNAKYLNELEALGFGFVEIGTVTPLPQAGNDKPRLFRLPKDKALINRMGFNNDGVEAIAQRLRSWQLAVGSRQSGKLQTENRKLVIGGNIGKNKITANEDAWKDYETCFIALHPYVDYFVVNVSSPNTPGLRELQEKESLRKIFGQLKIKNEELKIKKPVLLKIAPDLTTEQLDDVIDLAMEIKLDGLVAANTSISRDELKSQKSKLKTIGAGGLSGLPLKYRSTEIVTYISQKTNGKIPIIASGGIFTGEDAKEKIKAGASLLQVWTGFIYEGPSIVKRVCEGITSIQ
jgi:dihydroorotate dehydrogenase